MTFGEAILLTKALMQDPSSWVHASLAEWEHPASREFFVLADLFDAFGKVNFKKPSRYPRPLPSNDDATLERFGAPIAPADLGAVLNGFGREAPVNLVNWPGYEAPERPATELGKPRPRVVANPHD